MGSMGYIRQIYLDAEHDQKAKSESAKNPRGNPRPPYDRALEGVLESTRVLIPVTRRIDIDRMLRFAAELKLKAVLYGAVEGYRSADLLKNTNVPVLVNLKWPEKARDSDPEEEDSMRVLENRANAPSTPAVFAKNAGKFAFYSGGIRRPSGCCSNNQCAGAWRNPMKRLLLIPVLASVAAFAAAPILIQNATVLTVTNGTFQGSVLIRDGKIAEVGEKVMAPAGATIIDATGKYLMPGIIDCHSHIAADSINEGSVSGSSMVGIED